MEFPSILGDENDENYIDDPLLGEAAESQHRTSQQDVEEKQGDALLVELIANYPIIYDKTLSEYKNTTMRENCWIAIGTIMQKPPHDCMKRWAQLRESFGRERKKREEESRSGSGAANKRRGFVLYEDMRFLEKHITKRTTFTNVLPVSRASHFRTPLKSVIMDNNIQTHIPLWSSLQNIIMPGPSMSIPRVISPSTPYTLTNLTEVPEPSTPPSTPTPPLHIPVQTPPPYVPTPSPPATTSMPHQYTPVSTPSPDRHVLSSPSTSTSSSHTLISENMSYSTTSAQSPGTKFASISDYIPKPSSPSLQSDTISQRSNTLRTTPTSVEPVINECNTRYFYRPQLNSSWRKNNIITESPPPPCKLAKLNACYTKELKKPKKIDPIESSFINLSSAIQNHFTNPVPRETDKTSMKSTDADDLFGNLIATELKKFDESIKTAKKARILQILYEKE